MKRIGVASIVQETNTFSPHASTLHDFRSQSLVEGEDVARVYRGTNTEAGGALERVEQRGAVAVPIMRAWAMSSGRVTAETLAALQEMLRRGLAQARPLDGLVLSLHGAMVADDTDGHACPADAALLDTARAALGPDAVIGVCLDLHANVTPALVAGSDVLIGYHTYPHVDQAATGGRIADLVIDRLEQRRRPVTALAKRAMLIPAEAQGEDGPLGALRAAADRATTGDVLDISLFPVQPWLDVEELGFAVTVTTDGDAAGAQALAEQFAARAWQARHAFTVELVDPVDALERVRRSTARRPALLSESADSPTAGATADSPAMVHVLLDHGADLRAYVTLVDGPAVAACFASGEGATVDLTVGCQYERRFHRPVPLQGVVRRLGAGSYHLAGPVFTGMAVTMGRYAVVTHGPLAVLLTEQPACTFDPTTFEHAGLPIAGADVVVVRSATLFRAGFAGVAGPDVFILDLPGASTPRLDTLTFERAPRPLYPLEDW